MNEDKDYTIKRWAPKFVRDLIDDRFVTISVSDLTKQAPFEGYLSVTCPGFEFCRLTVMQSVVQEVDEKEWQRVNTVSL